MDRKKSPFIIVFIVATVVVVGGAFVLWSKNSPRQNQPPEQQELSVMPYDICVTDDDCSLIQEEYCNTVHAVAKNRVFEWREKDAKQTETARRERQTCELMPEGYLDIKNFSATCRQSRCVAQFIQ